MSRWARLLSRLARDPRTLGPAVRHHLAPLARYVGDGSHAAWPRELILYVTASCNAHCPMCDIGARRESSFSAQLAPAHRPVLPLAAFARLLGQVRRFSPELNFNGVEPLLHPHIVEMIGMAHAAGLPTKLVTNGILLADLAAPLADANLDRLVVSLDGREEVHDVIRGAGTYRRATEGIAAVLRRRGRSRHPELTVNCCVSGPNVAGLAAFVRHALADLRVDSVRLSHLNYVTAAMSAAHNDRHPELATATPQSIGAEPERVDVEALWRELVAIRRRVPRSRTSFGCELRSPDEVRAFYREPSVVLGRGRCATPWTSATITPAGEVIVRNRCIAFTAGNAFEQPFGEIWRGGRYAAFRRELARTGLFPVCTRCCGAL